MPGSTGTGHALLELRNFASCCRRMSKDCRYRSRSRRSFLCALVELPAGKKTWSTGISTLNKNQADQSFRTKESCTSLSGRISSSPMNRYIEFVRKLTSLRCSVSTFNLTPPSWMTAVAVSTSYDWRLKKGEKLNLSETLNVQNYVERSFKNILSSYPKGRPLLEHLQG
jgi:hypothetical protein